MSATTSSIPDPPTVEPVKPTIVLVHGAWADSSSWARVIKRLRASGYPVHAIANPLQGLVSDTAYLSSYLATIEGPMVLVGHSYGGAVITNVDASAFDIRSLVYVAGFIPIKGETVGQLAAQSSPPLPLVSVEVPGGAEVAIDPVGFRDAFAGDVDDETAAELAIVQRPANVKAVSEAHGQRGVSFSSVLGADHPAGPGDPPRPADVHGRPHRRPDHRGRRLARGHDQPPRRRRRRHHASRELKAA